MKMKKVGQNNLKESTEQLTNHVSKNVLLALLIGYILGHFLTPFSKKTETIDQSISVPLPSSDNNEKVYVMDLTSSPNYSLVMCDKSKLYEIYEHSLQWVYSKSFENRETYREKLYQLYQLHCSSDSYFVDAENVEGGLIKNE